MSKENLEQLAAAQKANTEALLAVLRTAFKGVEQLTALNISASRDFFNHSVNNAKQLLEAKDPATLGKLNTALAQPSLEKWLDYSRNVYELTSQIQKEMSAVIENQYTSFTKDATAAVQKAKTSAPVGGDVFAAALQSVLNASTQAFENMNSVTRQLSDIADANIQAATKATAAPAKTSATAAAAKKSSSK